MQTTFNIIDFQQGTFLPALNVGEISIEDIDINDRWKEEKKN